MGHTKEEIDALLVRLYNVCRRDIIAMVKKDFACAPYAEDILQDVFKEAVRNGEKLMTHENPAGWIFETARNKMMNKKRKVHYRSQKEDRTVDINTIAVDDDFGIVELFSLLDSTLNKHEKMLIYMYHYEGYSARELAAMEGITEGNFKVRMLRLRKKLKEELDDKG